MIITKIKFNTLLDVLLTIVVILSFIFIFRYFHFFYMELRSVHLVFLYGGTFGLISAMGILVYARDYLYKKQIEIVLLVISLCASLLLAEFAYNMIDPIQPRFVRHHYLNHVLNTDFIGSEGNKEHNSLGFRGPEIEVPKPENTVRILNEYKRDGIIDIEGRVFTIAQPEILRKIGELG